MSCPRISSISLFGARALALLVVLAASLSPGCTNETSSGTSAALCGDPHWLPGGGLPGADVFVAASVSWDPDGAGPEPELLVIAGDFQIVGDRVLRGLAAWDGMTWRELDPDSGGDIYSIRALAVYGGDLIAAGSFSTLGGAAVNDIARFDGAQWHPLGAGPDNGITGSLGFASVNTLRVVGDRLLVGGQFDLAGGVGAINVAAWDGASATWSALGDGLSAGRFLEGVFSFTEYGGDIVAAGDFTLSGATTVSGVARFDGAAWTDFAPLGSLDPYCVGVHGGELFAAGSYYDFGNPDPEYFGESTVARWDEGTSSWVPMGSSLGSPGFLGVAALTEFDGQLYASGDFGDFFDFDAPGMLLRRWDGVDWSAVGTDFGGLTGFQPTVAAISVHQGRLIVGGAFSHAGGVGAFNLAAWDGAFWSSFGSGTNGRVQSLVEFGDGVVAGGPFDSIEGAPLRKLAFWDGKAWSALGDGSITNALPIGVFDGELLITASGLDGAVRRLHGNRWLPFGEGIPNGFVRCMTTFEGQLIVGGNFSFTGFHGETIDCVALWDGTHWRALGAGVSGKAWNQPAAALAVYGGKLIVAGALDMAGGSPANAIASWDGSVWQSLGDGLFDPPGNVIVWDLEVFGGELFATGQFEHAGSVAARNIARWDGAEWRSLGAGGETTLTSWGRALTVLEGALYVGGSFSSAGGVEVHNIARWDGAQFTALDGGVDPEWFGGVEALAQQGGRLFIGGAFVQTGSGVSAFLARWGCD